VAERTGREVDAAELAFRMHAEQAVVAAVRREIARREPAAQRERGVERERRVSFREHEAVAVGIVGIGDAQDAAVERRQDVGDRQRRADVADVRAT
jgi:hypothetical protein